MNLKDVPCKICFTCVNFDEDDNTCNSPLPNWIKKIDPFSRFTSDQNRNMNPEDNADDCKLYRHDRLAAKNYWNSDID